MERGAKFVDLNAGCPIHDVVRRGMGSTLLQRPATLAKVVEAMSQALPVPVTVKIRSGWSESKVNAPEVARLAEEAGAAALTLHARSKEQRYVKAANWDLVAQLVQERSIPIIGNGDILTHYEARRRQEQSGCAAVMVARGALIKPWIFREISEEKTWLPTAKERLAIYRQLAQSMREHFRDDELGKKRAMRFLPWHMGFFCRYRPLPEELWGEKSIEHPLLQTRFGAEADLDLLEQLLRDVREEVHQGLADLLWDAQSDDQAEEMAMQLAVAMPPVSSEGQDFALSHG